MQFFQSLFDNKKNTKISLADNDALQIIKSFNKSKLGVDAYSESVQALDDSMKAYLKTQEKGNATLQGYRKFVDQSSKSVVKLGTKAALSTIKIQLLHVAMGLVSGLIIGGLSYGLNVLIDKVVFADKKALEAAENAKSNIQNIESELQNTSKAVDGYKDKYAELAQHVDQFTGKNLSLSTDDYKEFLNISNELAQVFPDLVKYYDENGNAILNLKGNVEDITTALEHLLNVKTKIANEDIVKELPKQFEGVNTSVETAKQKLGEYREEEQKILDLQNSIPDLQSYEEDISNKTTKLSYIFDDSYEDKIDNIVSKLYDVMELSDIVGTAQFSNSWDEEKEEYKYVVTVDLKNEDVKKFKTSVSDLDYFVEKSLLSTQSKIDNAVSDISNQYASLLPSFAAYMNTSWDYLALDNSLQVMVQQMISGVDWNQLEISNWEGAQEYIDKLTSAMRDNLSNKDKINLADVLVQKDDQSDQDYIRAIKQTIQDIQAKLDEQNVDVELNVDFLIANKEDTLNRFNQRVKELAPRFSDYDKLRDYTNEKSINTDKEYETFLKVTESATTAAEAIDLFNQYLEEQAKLVDKVDLEPIHKALDNIQAAYNTVSGAITEYKETHALSLDTVQSLLQLDDKYLAVLYDENGQLTLNKDTYESLTMAKLNDMQVGILLNAMNTVQNLKDEQAAKDYLKTVTTDLTSVKWEDVAATIAEAEAELTAAEARGKDVSSRRAALEQISASTQAKIKLLQSSIKSMNKNMGNFFKDTKSGANNAGRATKEFSEDIDWAANSVANLNRQLDELNKKLTDNKTYDQQTKVINNTIVKQEELLQLQKEIEKGYKDNYTSKLNALGSNKTKYKPLIESKKEISVESFKDKSLYDKVVAAQKAYQQYKDAKLAVTDTESNILSNEEKVYRLGQDKLEAAIARRENSKQDYQNKIDFNIATGRNVDEEWYTKIFNYNQKNIEDYINALDNAVTRRNSFKKDSEAYKNADAEVQELQNDIAKTRQEQVELNRSILKLPIHQLEKSKQVLEDELKVVQKHKERVTSAINAASGLVQDQIDYYEDLKETTTASYDKQIENIQKQKDKLTESNDSLKQQMALEKAKFALEKALNQKSVKIFRNGQFVYEADQDAIKDAKQAYDEEVYNSQIGAFDREIKSIEDAKKIAIDALDVQIESLNDYKERLDNIFNSMDKILGLQDLASTFGVGFIERVLAGDNDAISEMESAYNEVYSDELSLQKRIEQYDIDIEKINTIADTWNGSVTTIEKAKKKIQEVVTNNEKEIKSIDQRIKSAEDLATTWDKKKISLEEDLGLINESHDKAKEKEYNILQERIKNLKEFAEQASGYLSQIQTALGQAETAKKKIEETKDKVTKSAIDIVANSVGKTIGGALGQIGTMGKSHEGMELGYIGENSSVTKDNFKYIALSKLKPDEVPRILQNKEAVLTALQQQTVMDNMQTAFYSGLQHNVRPIPITQAKSNRSIALNGDIVLQGVQDTDTLAKCISRDFLVKLDQEMYK